MAHPTQTKISDEYVIKKRRLRGLLSYVQTWRSLVLNQCFIVLYLRFIFNYCARHPVHTKVSVIRNVVPDLRTVHKIWPLSTLKALITMSYESVPCWIREIPGRLKKQEMCDKAVWIEPRSLSFVPDRFKTEGVCIKAVRRNPYALDYVPDYLKTQKM